jgi:2-dehydro-3-deoxyphosphooctonate aldolase (KDO 8-P synthase)
MPSPRIRIAEGVEAGGGAPLLLIAGPDSIESEAHALKMARALREIARARGVALVYKSSFDKANRTSGTSFRGPGMAEGLRILARVKHDTGLPLTTDFHTPDQAEALMPVIDLVQVPAMLSRQTDMLAAAAATGRAVNVKKGQFLAPWDARTIVEKVRLAGGDRVMLTERGTTFGYGQLVNDMRAIPWMQELGCPVIFDATHSVQMPGGQGDRSGGDRRMVPHLARAAVACGCDGLFMETHPRPDEALSDGPNMVPLGELPDLIRCCLRLRDALAG